MTSDKARILVVDDEADLTETIRRILARAGFDTVAAADPADALRRAQDEAFDLVVTDLRMPGLPGAELIRRLRQLHPPPPVVVVTGMGMAEAGLEALKAGAADALAKPFEPEELVFRVCRALACEQLQRENSRLRQRVDSGS